MMIFTVFTICCFIIILSVLVLGNGKVKMRLQRLVIKTKIRLDDQI